MIPPALRLAVFASAIFSGLLGAHRDPPQRITIDTGTIEEINLAYAPEANIGDYVLVHVGFALTVIDAAEAAKVFEHLDRIGEIEAELRTEAAS